MINVSRKATEARKFKVPHTLVIISAIILVAVLLTYVVPAGVFDRVEDQATGRTVIDPDSFTHVEQSPVKIFSFTELNLFTAIPKGMQEAASIIFFIFIVNGAFSMIQGTGAIEASIGKAVGSLEGKEKLLIPATMLLFALGGATFGMAEETLVFVPIGVALARALKFDAITGVAMVTMGAAVGFNSGFMNPFTVGVAQGIAQIPLFSGIGMRLIIFAVLLAISTWYILRYAMKVRKNPELSYVYDLEKENNDDIDLSNLPEFSIRHGLVLLTVVLGFAAIIYGVFKYGWYINEIAAMFFAMGLVASFVGGVGPSDTASNFVEGAKAIAFGALVVGFARVILVVLESGQVIDALINYLATSISNFPSVIASLLMYLVQILINIVIPSGSGQAATTMPIMAPLADLVGISRQTAVLAYQFGDGFTNSIIPTSAVLMSYLAIAKIPYEKWVKWILPLMGYWIGTGAIFMIIATLINY